MAPGPDRIASMEVSRRHDRSMYMSILQKIIRPFKKLLVKSDKEFPDGAPRLKASSAAKKLCHVQERKVEDVWIYDLTSKSNPARIASRKSVEDALPARNNMRRRVYYLAGGGFRMEASPQHWKLCALLATKLSNATISIISYPLVPHFKAPATFPKLSSLMRVLLREASEAGERVIFAGDSSGGNLALSLTLDALQSEANGNERLEYPPIALLSISPAVDLTNTNFEMAKIEKDDPVLTVAFTGEVAETWRADWSAEDPRISPINANLALLKEKDIKVLGVTGGADVLTPDALVFLEKCTEAGVRGRWLHWEKQMHCFPLALGYGLREPREGFNWIVEALSTTFDERN